MKSAFLALTLGLGIAGCVAAKDKLDDRLASFQSKINRLEAALVVAQSIGDKAIISEVKEQLVAYPPEEEKPVDPEPRPGQAIFGAIFVLVQAFLKYFLEGRKAGAT